MLILGITVILFSSLLYWVWGMPAPAGTVSVDIVGTLEYWQGSRAPYKYNLTLTHRGGETLVGWRTQILIQLNNNYVIKTTIGSCEPSVGDELNVGELWRFDNNTANSQYDPLTSPIPPESLRVNVIVFDLKTNTMVWSATLPGYSELGIVIFSRGTSVYDTMSPIPGWIDTRIIYQGQSFKLFAVVRAESAVSTVVVNLSPLGFSSAVSMSYLKNKDRYETTAYSSKNIQNGSYLCQIFATDIRGRSTTASIEVIIRSGPDLGVDAKQIWFSNYHPILGDKLSITAAIRNYGNVPAQRANVSFYDSSLSRRIDDVNISVPVSGQTTVTVNWVADRYGDHIIWVNITDVYPIDPNTDNNNAACMIKVYVFYDDLENGTKFWRHEATVLRINGESPLDYLNVSKNSMRISSEWSEMFGFSQTSGDSHSYPGSFALSSVGTVASTDILLPPEGKIAEEPPPTPMASAGSDEQPTATLTVYSAGDTFVVDTSPNSNYGTAYGVVVGRSYGNFREGYRPRARALFRFSSISSIPRGSTVNSATLYLYQYYSWGDYYSYPGPVPISVHRVTAPWNEYTATWNNMAYNYAGQIIDTQYIPSGRYGWTWRSWNVRSLVQDWVDGRYPDYGLMLKSNWENSYYMRAFATKEWTYNGPKVPYIVITYTIPTLSVSVSANPSTIDWTQTSTITVYVTSGGNPIQAAQVSMSSSAGGSFTPASGTTNAQGIFTTTFRPPFVTSQTVTTITATATKTGYISGSGSTQVTITLPTTTVSVNANPTQLVAGQQSTITVSVTSGGTALSSASVSLSLSPNIGTLNPSSGTTNSQGIFTATYTAGSVSSQTTVTITATATKSGYQQGTGSTTITILYPSISVSISANPTQLLSGQQSTITVLASALGSALPGAAVTLSSNNGGTFNPQSGTTDNQGRFVSTWTAPTVTQQTVCRITATVSKTGYQTGSNYVDITVLYPSLSVSVSANPTTLLSGETSTITVYVHSNGNAIGGASVSLSSSAGGTFSPQSGTTDLNGYFISVFTAPTVTQQTDCIITATVSKPGYAPGSGNVIVTVAYPQITVSVSANQNALLQGQSCTITVFAITNYPRPNTQLAAASVSLSLSFSPNTATGTLNPQTGTTDNNGEFASVFTVTNVWGQCTATISATVSKSGYSTGSGSTNVQILYPPLQVSVIAAQTVLYSQQSTTITVQVTSSGNNVQGATVTLSSSAGGTFTPQSGTTNNQGIFTSTFTAPTVNQQTVCRITATASKIGYAAGSGYVDITVLVSQLVVTVASNPSSVTSNGTSAITVNVKALGNPMAGASITLSVTNGGTCNPSSGVTDASGNFYSTFRAPRVFSPTVCRVTATATKAGYQSGSGYTDIAVGASDRFLITYPISLKGGVEGIRLTFWQKYNLTQGGNGVVLLVGTLHGSEWMYRYVTSQSPYPGRLATVRYDWNSIEGGGPSGPSDRAMEWAWNGVSGGGKFIWEYVEVDLSSFVPGKPNNPQGSDIRIQFRYLLTSRPTTGGYWLDDVELKLTCNETLNPLPNTRDRWQYDVGSVSSGTTHSGTHTWWHPFDMHGDDNSLLVTINLVNVQSAWLNAYIRFNIGLQNCLPPFGLRLEISNDNGANWYWLTLGHLAANGTSGGSDNDDGIYDGRSLRGLTEPGERFRWIPLNTLSRIDIDLSRWAGSVVILRFRVITPADTNVILLNSTAAGFSGIYIDDVMVTGNATSRMMRNVYYENVVEEHINNTVVTRVSV